MIKLNTFLLLPAVTTHFIQNPRSAETSVIFGQKLYYSNKFVIALTSFRWIFLVDFLAFHMSL